MTSVASAPWLKAPILLRHFPGLLLATGCAVLILASASAAGPLFLSSVGNATLQRTLADSCPWDVGLEMRFTLPLAGDDFIGGDLSGKARRAQALLNEDHVKAGGPDGDDVSHRHA